MSFISVNAPTLSASVDNMKDFLRFVYTNESLLKEHGAMKIIPPVEIKKVLKKIRMKLSPPSTIQKITKLNENDLTYSIDTIPSIPEKNSKQQSLSISEGAFWLSLSQIDQQQQQLSTVSVIPKQSLFLKRVHRMDFDIHQLPRQSLLRLCDDNRLREFVPSLTRAHGPGAIFPLASTRQRLFSFNYHHDGGIRHWYIIPASEREALEHAFQQQQMKSVCLDHGQILIDPLMLDKYKIRHYRLTQQPNEIVVLAAGCLSQSFTENASWSETIDFALPSWLDDGHASAEISCLCQSNIITIPEIIDVKLFNPTLVQRYITTSLNIVTNPKPLSNTEEQNMEINDAPIFSNISLTPTDQFSDQIAESSIGNSSFGSEVMNDYTPQRLITTPMANSFPNESDGFSCLTTPHQHQTPFNSVNDLYQLSSPEDLYDGRMATSTDELRYLSFQEILDIIATPPSTVKSIECQTEELFDTTKNTFIHPSSPDQNTQMKYTNRRHSNNHHQRYRSVKDDRHSNKTLIISGLRYDVTKYDIRHHFTGCVKVTMKQSYLPPYLNYAFVLHRSSRDAEFNLKRPIKYYRFGSSCRVEYAKGKNTREPCEYQNARIWNVMVKRIPENVSEECLRSLFPGCNSMKYIPARIISKPRKVLWGYAFLHYIHSKEAADVVKNDTKYKINNQLLSVSFFDNMKSSWTSETISYNPRSSRHYQSSKRIYR